MSQDGKMRDEHQQANDHRAQGGDQHRSGRHILGAADPGMPLRMEGIGQLLECGIEGFGAPDQDNGRGNPYPFRATQPEVNPCGADEKRGQQMQPRIGLGEHKMAHTLQGAGEASQAGDDGFFHGWQMLPHPMVAVTHCLVRRLDDSGLEQAPTRFIIDRPRKADLAGEKRARKRDNVPPCYFFL